MQNSEEYFNALIDCKKFHDNPEGFSSEHTGSIQDQIIIKQNNVILMLLIRILDKLDSIKTHISDKAPEIKGELEALVQNLKNIKIDPAIKARPKEYTFFARPIENKSEKTNRNEAETSKKNDKTQ